MTEDNSTSQLIEECKRLKEELRQYHDHLDDLVEERTAELMEEYQLLQTLLDKSPDIIYAKDRDGRFLIANAALVRSMGVTTRKKIIGKTDFDFHPKLLAEQHYTDEQKLLQTGESMVDREETLLEWKTGKTLWYLTTKIPLRDSQGNIIGLVGISRNNTEHKKPAQVQAALYHISEASHTAQTLDDLFPVIHSIVGGLMPARNFYIALYDSVSDILQFPYYVDEYGEIPTHRQLWKRIAEYILRTKRPVLATPEVFELFAKPQNLAPDQARPGCWLGIPLKTPNGIIGVLAVQSYTRKFRYSEEDKRLLTFVSSQIATAIERVRTEEELKKYREHLEELVKERTAELMTVNTHLQQEIVERKQAEIELRIAHTALQDTNAQLQELNASKDKFFSIISHDLKSPLNIMIGFSQLLEERFDAYSTEQIKTRIGKLRKAAERLHASLENLHTWSRIQRAAMVYHPNNIDLHEIAEEMLELFTTKAEQKELILKTSLEKGIMVYADYNMLHTVLRNLISNAMKFTDQGGMIELAAIFRNEHDTEISVADSGMGIKPEDLEKLFRIDVQYTNLGTAGEKGTGLGLSLCKDLVEKNGGTIWVESEVEKGTTFRFTVPKATIKD